MVHAAARDRNRRDRMFEDQLLQIAGFKHQREFIEAFDLARQLHAAHEIDRHVDAVAAQGVQKAVLYVLGVLCWVFHFPNRLSLLIFCLFVFLFKQFGIAERGYSNRKTQGLPNSIAPEAESSIEFLSARGP